MHVCTINESRFETLSTTFFERMNRQIIKQPRSENVICHLYLFKGDHIIVSILGNRIGCTTYRSISASPKVCSQCEYLSVYNWLVKLLSLLPYIRSSRHGNLMMVFWRFFDILKHIMLNWPFSGRLQNPLSKKGRRCGLRVYPVPNGDWKWIAFKEEMYGKNLFFSHCYISKSHQTRFWVPL